MKTLITALLFIACALSSHADMLELKDGKLLKGTYQGGTTGTIRFETAGKIEVFPVSAVLALTISRPDGPTKTSQVQAPAPPPQSVHAPAVQQQPHVVPAGSEIIIKLRSELSTASARSGGKFDAILQTDLRAGSVILAPRGSLVKGTITEVRKPRRLVKIAVLAFTLDEVVVGNNAIHLSTHPNRTETKPDGSIIKGAIAGAIIGEVVDDDGGHGAAAGASLGALKRGNDIAFPAGALISFKLSAAVKVSP